MANARIVLAQGVIDGSNRVFGTGVPYVAGSTAYILNGRIHSPSIARGPDNDYGYSELDPASGTIEVDNAPVDGDVVQIFFWDRMVQPVSPVAQLTGIVRSTTPLVGVAREPQTTRLSGIVRSSKLTGVVREPGAARLAGVIRSQRIVGTIKERC
jgi:hypothetical protein